MRISIRRPAAAALMSLSLAGGGLLVGGSPADAYISRPVFGTPFGSLSTPFGVAIDQSTGNVYVADDGEPNDVKILGPQGEAPVGGLPASIDGSDSTSKSFSFYGYAQAVAFDSKSDLLYVSDANHNVVDKYKVNGSKVEFVCEFTGYGGTGSECTSQGGTGDAIALHEPMGVAVDSAGNVYITQTPLCCFIGGPSPIYEYSASDEDVAEYMVPVTPTYTVVAPTGPIYTIQWFGGALYEVKRKSLTGAMEGEPEAITGGGVSGVAYDEKTSDLFVGYGTFVQELNANKELVSTTEEGALEGSAGVAVNEASDHLYVAQQSYIQSHKDIVQFGEGVVLPDVTTGSATEVGRDKATLSGTVNPDGTKAKYWFEYGTTPYAFEGKTSPVEVEGEAPLQVKAVVTGLKAETFYYFRIVASNQNGKHQGSWGEFTTLTAVEGLKTNAATGVTTESANLNGQLEPNGYAASCWFEYSGTPWYGNWWESFSGSKTAVQQAGSGTEVKQLTAPAPELEPNRTYYYRISCENSFGLTHAPVETFTTVAAPPVIYSESTEDISRDRAVLVAEVAPNNSPTTYYFEYGLTSEYGYKTAITPTSSTQGKVIVKAPAVELAIKTVYHYRVTVKNATGTVVGADQTFTSGHPTPPVVETGGVSAINPNGATVYGTLSTEGLVSTYGFRVGTNPANLGPPTGMGAVGAGYAQATVSLELYGLQPHTTYYYRVVGENGDNVGQPVEGEVHSFTTASYPNPNITVQQLRVLTEPFVEWPPFAPQANTACPAGCTPEIRVVSHSVHGKLAVITVSVPSPGRLTAHGSGIHKATVVVHKAGTLTMRLRLSKSGRQFLAHHHGRNLVVPIMLSFAPSHGPRLSARVAVLMQ